MVGGKGKQEWQGKMKSWSQDGGVVKQTHLPLLYQSLPEGCSKLKHIIWSLKNRPDFVVTLLLTAKKKQ